MLQLDTLRRSLLLLAPALVAACGAAAGSDPAAQTSAAGGAESALRDPSAGTAEIGSTSEALSTTCNATTWQDGKSYDTGDVVSYGGKYYVAVHANPGYTPTVSTWYWDPTTCSSTSTSTTSTSTSCNATAWQQGKSYDTGDVVTYSGKYYVATHDNPGYDPTISTWYWSPKSGCTSTSSSASTSSTSGSSAFERIVSRSMFDKIFPSRNSFYTYDGLVKAAKIYPTFASSGSLDTQKREVAAFLANVTHETGALVYIEQIVKSSYCDSSSACPCASGKQYYGRGPLQLSWNYNYCDASQVLFGNTSTLRTDPGRVAREAWVAWGTGLWFWMKSEGAGRMTAHSAMVNVAGFGETIRTINGAQECNGGYPEGVSSRVNAYKRICSLLGVSPGSNLTC